MVNAEQMDKILEFISNEENKTDNFNCYSLKKHLFPDLHADVVKLLILEIYEGNPYVCVIEEPYPFSNPVIYSNGVTREFLDNGGFTKIKSGIENEQNEEKLRQEKKDKSLDLSIVSTQFNIEASKYDKLVRNRIMIWGFVISVLSFVISALTSGLFSSDDTKYQQNNQEVTQEQIQLLSREKDSLISVLNKKIDSLYIQNIKNYSLSKN